MSTEDRNRVLIDFGDGVERECVLVRPGPEGSWLIRSPEGAEGYYSGPFRRVIHATHTEETPR